jgi:hypothetical protein
MFPGYLLPSSERHAIDLATAERFLGRLDPRPELLDLLLRSSLIAGCGDQLHEFCARLAELVRVLPSRTHVERRLWDGGFHGRLAIAETTAQRAAGASTRFVTRTRRRGFDLPENELVVFVAKRLLTVIGSLRKHDLLPKPSRDSDPDSRDDSHEGSREGSRDDSRDDSHEGSRDGGSHRGTKHKILWKSDALACEAQLDALLHKTVLNEVPEIAAVTAYHEQAAEAAVHPCYQEALAWHRRMSEALDDHDERRLAQVLAQGALRPLSEDAQFELAVLIRLVEAIAHVCEPGGWRFERSIVLKNRTSVARFYRDDGAGIEVFYNQAVLPQDKETLGPRDHGVRHYFHNKGRFRPDVTVVVQRPGQPPRGVVLEVKNSHRRSYLESGYQEALLYRYEYAEHLIQWPKAVLVCAGPVPGAVSRRHDVVAVDWQRWAPAAIIEAIVPSRLPR